ncbi:MAG TPA: DUF3786 domain-containing protein [Spirochaetia bacterium]|nr:DUF3786 domain-containing protein [Spirochaetia bacterium]
MSARHKYWRVWEEAVASLLHRDLAERCAAAGYRYEGDGIKVVFLDRRYVLVRHGSSLTIVNADPGSPEESTATEEAASLSSELQEEHLRDRILILHYLERASGAPLSGNMVGFDQLSGARFYGSPFRGRVELPLVQTFSSRPGALLESAQALGGSAASYGDCSVLLHPFPRVPLAFILWQGDDEIPANGKMLFDACAEDYLSAEDLTVLGETVVRRFRALDTEVEPRRARRAGAALGCTEGAASTAHAPFKA